MTIATELRALAEKWRGEAAGGSDDDPGIEAGCRLALGNCADELQSLLDALAQLDDGWRPIAEAPKDRRVLLWANHQMIGGWDEFERCWSGCGVGLMRAYPPTHFRPLPSPPEQEPTR